MAFDVVGPCTKLPLVNRAVVVRIGGVVVSRVTLDPDMAMTDQGLSTLSERLTVGTVVNQPIGGGVQNQLFLFPHFHQLTAGNFNRSAVHVAQYQGIQAGELLTEVPDLRLQL